MGRIKPVEFKILTAAGAVTLKRLVRGTVRKVQLNAGDLAAGTDIVLQEVFTQEDDDAEVLGEIIATITDLAPLVMYPHRAAETNAGVALLYAATFEVATPFVVAGNIRCTVSGATGAQQGEVIVFVEE